MKRLCIIPCGSKKIWDVDPEAGETEARYAYRSAFHQACQTYARTFFSDWVILSAKHGFLLPHDKVPSNYDVAFGTANPDIIPIAELITQAKERNLDAYEEVVVLGGKKFAANLPRVFPTQQIVYPLADCKGIGYMLQKLKRSIEQDREIETAKADDCSG